MHARVNPGEGSRTPALPLRVADALCATRQAPTTTHWQRHFRGPSTAAHCGFFSPRSSPLLLQACSQACASLEVADE